jgi:nuclear cap-binding protein subunit 1
MLAVLSELGGGGDRAERVVRSVGEGLLRVSTADFRQFGQTQLKPQSGSHICEHFPEDLDSIIESIEASVTSRRGGKTLRNPLSPVLPDGEEAETYNDVNQLKYIHLI